MQLDGKVCIDLVELGLHEPGQPIDIARLRQGILPNGTDASAAHCVIVEHLEYPRLLDVLKSDMVIQTVQ